MRSRPSRDATEGEWSESGEERGGVAWGVEWRSARRTGGGRPFFFFSSTPSYSSPTPPPHAPLFRHCFPPTQLRLELKIEVLNRDLSHKIGECTQVIAERDQAVRDLAAVELARDQMLADLDRNGQLSRYQQAVKIIAGLHPHHPSQVSQWSEVDRAAPPARQHATSPLCRLAAPTAALTHRSPLATRIRRHSSDSARRACSCCGRRAPST